jgi:hypothetical protein
MSISGTIKYKMLVQIFTKKKNMQDFGSLLFDKLKLHVYTFNSGMRSNSVCN